MFFDMTMTDAALTKALNKIAELESQVAAEKARADKAESAVAFAARGRLALPPEPILFERSDPTFFNFPSDGRQKGWRVEHCLDGTATVGYDWLTLVMEGLVCPFNDKGTYAVHDGHVSGRLRQIRFGR